MSVQLRNLPKVELHVHLDCSLSFAAVHQLDPTISNAAYLERFVAPWNARGLPDYLRRAQEGIRLMQTTEQLHITTLDLFEQFRNDHITYAEIRFAPLEHVREGLTPKAVVEAVEAATYIGIRNTGVEARLILCTLRHYTAAQSMETVQLVHAFRNGLVAGFDLAGDEAGYSLDAHCPAFQYAHQQGIPCTAHAGESKGSESVWETLEKLQPQRIGHGVRSVHDPALLKELIQRKIHLEVCPTSNLRTRVFPTINTHAVDALYQAGVSIGINTDGRTISLVSLTAEYELLQHTFGWNTTHFLTCNLNALDAAFLPANVRTTLKSQLVAAYGI